MVLKKQILVTAISWDLLHFFLTWITVSRIVNKSHSTPFILKLHHLVLYMCWEWCEARKQGHFRIPHFIKKETEESLFDSLFVFVGQTTIEKDIVGIVFLLHLNEHKMSVYKAEKCYEQHRPARGLKKTAFSASTLQFSNLFHCSLAYFALILFQLQFV